MVNETIKPKAHWLKPALIALAVVAVGALSWFAYKNPQLFRAALTGGTATPTTPKTIYIPSDYFATGAGDGGKLEVKAGTAISNLGYLDITFSYSPDQITMFPPPPSNILAEATDALAGKTATITQLPADNPNTFRVLYTGTNLASPGISVAPGQTLFRLPFTLTAASGSVQINNTGTFVVKTWNTTPDPDVLVDMTDESFGSGLIAISSTAPTCSNDCGQNGACNFQTRQCECNPGYAGPSCNRCATGFIGFPTCTQDIFADLKGAILTLSPDAIASLTPAEKKKAYSSVYVIFRFNSIAAEMSAVGARKITIEGTDLTLGDDGGATLLDLINELGANILNGIDPDLSPIVGVNGSVVTGMNGVIKLDAATGNVDGSLDGITTTSGDVLIVPAMENTLTLLPTVSYKTRVIGIFQNDGLDTNIVKDLNYTDLQWMPQPTNRLKSDALNGGLLEKGDAVGKGPLYIQVEKAEAAPIRSNEMVVEVPAGPVIDYARIIGSGSIERGGRVNLSVKISDVDTISDIEDIRSSIVRSSASTYGTISADTDAVWFTATPFVDEVTVTENVTVPPTTPETPAPTATTTPAPKNYRVYSIPVEIPQDANLVDGPYKLVLVITDKAGHENASVIPVTIGKAASGDVNGDGKVTMLDVIMAYQIANGKLASPTPAQIEAANLDGKGNVTMLDVVLLFNKVNKK